MSPSFHPPKEFLVDFAAGSLLEPLALVVATHVALCTPCRAEVADDEALGGVLLDRLAPEPVTPCTRNRVMGRLDEDVASPLRQPPTHDAVLPAPVLIHLPMDLNALPWQPLLRGIKAVELSGAGAVKTCLVQVRAGRIMPRHRHEGHELVCFLAGGYTDAFGHYRRGDFSFLGPGTEHRPVMDPDEDCVCVALADAPLHFAGRFGRIVNPLLRG